MKEATATTTNLKAPIDAPVPTPSAPPQHDVV